VLVATPIGNLGDLSPRARGALAEADLVCCEDTRRTRELLSYAQIKGRKLLSFHAHNEKERVEEVLRCLRAGQTVALVSDAGTPSVSDPGGLLVERSAAEGIEVSAVPGPSAVMTALVTSGLPTRRFTFEGFLPRSGVERRKRLSALGADERTVVIFEAPTRLARTLADLVEVCGGDRPVAVARELTKLHEEIWRGRLEGASEAFERVTTRGEVVIVLGGAAALERDRASDEDLENALRRHLGAGRSVRDSAAAASEELAVARRRAYEMAVMLHRALPAKGSEASDSSDSSDVPDLPQRSRNAVRRRHVGA
jgi:16S rRNA (cytidine1402-2'-O)-methyltransferase